MELVWFLLVGLIAGWIAGEIVRGHGFGLLGNMAVGIVGAVIGGYLFGLLNVGTYGLIGSIVTAAVGAVVLLLIINGLNRARS